MPKHFLTQIFIFVFLIFISTLFLFFDFETNNFDIRGLFGLQKEEQINTETVEDKKITDSESEIKKDQIQIGQTVFNILREVTNEEKSRGLSGLESIPDDTGMLFFFDKPDTYGFWMKEMLFPIDIIWIGADFKIVDFTENIPVDSYPKIFKPKIPAQYVLEINTGLIEKNNFQIGDNVNFLLNK